MAIMRQHSNFSDYAKGTGADGTAASKAFEINSFSLVTNAEQFARALSFSASLRFVCPLLVTRSFIRPGYIKQSLGLSNSTGVSCLAKHSLWEGRLTQNPPFAQLHDPLPIVGLKASQLLPR